MMMQQRTRQAIKQVGIPVSVFCRKVGISSTAYYRWQTNDLRLADVTVKRINEYVSRLERSI